MHSTRRAPRHRGATFSPANKPSLTTCTKSLSVKFGSVPLDAFFLCPRFQFFWTVSRTIGCSSATRYFSVLTFRSLSSLEASTVIGLTVGRLKKVKMMAVGRRIGMNVQVFPIISIRYCYMFCNGILAISKRSGFEISQPIAESFFCETETFFRLPTWL